MVAPAVTTFSVTWDYRCPFARNVQEHVLAGLADGAEWDVTFVPFSLGQVHVAEGEPPIWDRPDDDSGLLALQVGTHVRDTAPEAFPAVHAALFRLRHDQGGDLRDRDRLAGLLTEHGVDARAALAAVDDGSALARVREEHERAATEHGVWGVPTFVVGDAAAFARVLDRPGEDAAHARRTIDRILTLLVEAPTLNELKHTRIPF